MNSVVGPRAYIIAADHAGTGEKERAAIVDAIEEYEDMKSAFDKIAAGFEDAIAYAQGDESRAREAAPLDVKAVRKRTNLTQAQFSATYRLPLGSVRDWEQKRFQPDAGARTLLAMIAADPVGVREIIAKV